MEPAALLAELRSLEQHVPDLRQYQPSSITHHQWIWKLHALVHEWDVSEAVKIELAAGRLESVVFGGDAISSILGALYRAISRLEIKVAALPNMAFGPGAVYDFFKTLRDLLGSAKAAVFIVDPYLDDQVFDTYIHSVSKQVNVRILAREYGAQLRPAVAKFALQSGMTIAARTSKSIHDRVIFLDDRSCWVLGQSIKDAAKSKPTYLAPLDGESAGLKKADYERIWSVATVLI